MIAKARLTLAEFLAMPEEKPYREYFDGEAVPKPMPNKDHAIVVGRLTYLWLLLAERLGLTIDAGPEWRIVFPGRGRVFLPDFFVTVVDPETGDSRSGSEYPDIAIEVMSPDDRADQVLDKVNVYLESNITTWVVDPVRRTVTVFAPGAPSRMFASGQHVPATPVDNTATLSVDEIFSRLPRR